MTNKDLYVLIHSPLVGPLTWKLVGEVLRKRGLDALVPTLKDSPDSNEPFWKQHAESVSEACTQIPSSTSLILVAHSGAGPLLPTIRESLPNPVRAYMFVDAGIPRDEATRLDLMRFEDPKRAEGFQADLERGERFPTWSVDDLREVIPDESIRKQMVVELQPRGLDFFTEPIPVFDGWPDAPCIYIQFSAAYEQPAGQAKQADWHTYKLEAGHFHMLVDPEHVAALMIAAMDNSA